MLDNSRMTEAAIVIIKVNQVVVEEAVVTTTIATLMISNSLLPPPQILLQIHGHNMVDITTTSIFGMLPWQMVKPDKEVLLLQHK
jgi:hypothetical protein